MINVLIPMASKSIFFKEEEYYYPKVLFDIKGKTMIQHCIENLSKIKKQKNFIFIIREEDATKFHLDSIIRLLQPESKILVLRKETKGAICSALMAIDEIEKDKELIIANVDQIIDFDIDEILDNFRKRDLDAGVITFEEIHPRWSFVRHDKNGNIIEVSEKRPISKDAIAGFFYFKTGQTFIDIAFKYLKRGQDINGKFYLAPALNELVLENKKVGSYKIPNEKYFTFFSPKRIKEFEEKCKE